MTHQNELDRKRQLVRRIEQLEREIAELNARMASQIIRPGSGGSASLPGGGLPGQVLMIISGEYPERPLGYDWPRNQIA